MFKDVLKQLRESHGLTQEQLADALGIKAGAVGNYEQGQRLPKDDKMWIKIAQYFNVTVDYLMDAPTEVLSQKSLNIHISHAHESDPERTEVVKKILAYKNEEIELDEIDYAMHNEMKNMTQEQRLAMLQMAKITKQLGDKQKG